MVTGFVRMSDGRLVYYDANGVRLHGDVWLADGWHYFDPYDGRMCIGAVHRPGGWYYYDINGVRCTGPVIINGTTYYFNTYTGVMVTEQTYVDIDIDNTTNIDIDNIVVNDTDININDGDVADDEKDDAAVLSAYMDILAERQLPGARHRHHQRGCLDLHAARHQRRRRLRAARAGHGRQRRRGGQHRRHRGVHLRHRHPSGGAGAGPLRLRARRAALLHRAQGPGLRREGAQ